MRYSATHKAETRNHLLEVSGALAKKKGYSATGVDALTAAAGLTSGAFYNHFSSKAELFAALVERELEHSLAMIADNATGQQDKEWPVRQLQRYLSWKHVQNPEGGCPLPSLGAEIARADNAAREKFETALKQIQGIWEKQLGDRKLAWATLAQLVGSVLLARAMSSEKTGKEVLEASKSFLEQAFACRDAGPVP
ncbi:MAG: TetR/AcrR family transcriptional regulator [Burkholderiales bacterium]